jgi:hypothetical protein
MKGVGRVAEQNAHARGVERPMLFLWGKRTPGDGVTN